ncbi:MAG: hypothetical protein HY231_18745 [Acidobacteria bacterium]|nr:hypothetical protein [Acidobacteriota bacterium]
MKTTSKLTLLFAVLALVAATQGCGVVNKLRAKDSLNEGVREFNKGKYEEAEGKFNRALELSPEMVNAQLFYARALNARFEQSLTEPLGNQTIKAYDNIIKRNPNDQEAIDRALAFKANVYKQLGSVAASPEDAEKYKNKQHETLLERVNLPSAKPSAKADVYYTIGVDMWQASYSLNAPYVTKKQPIPPPVIEKMKPYIQKAHEYLQKAVSVEPNYANAYFYEKLTYLEEAKTNPTDLKKINDKVLEMQEKYNKIQGIQKQQATQTTETSTNTAK